MTYWKLWTLLCAWAPLSLFAQSFEGVVKMLPSDPAMSVVSLSIKDQKVLIEIGEGDDPIRILNDPGAGEVLVLVDNFQGEKWAVRIDPAELIAMAQAEGTAGPASAGLGLRATGATRTIGGYQCRQWTARTDDVEVEAWITGEVPLDLPALLPPGYETLIVDKNMHIARQMAAQGFILEYRARTRDGRSEYAFRMDVQQGPLAPGRFFPATDGYQVYDLMEAIQVAQEDPAKMEELMGLMRSLSGQ